MDTKTKTSWFNHKNIKDPSEAWVLAQIFKHSGPGPMSDIRCFVEIRNAGGGSRTVR